MVRLIYLKVSLWIILIAIANFGGVSAQLSPGDLHEVHAQLEGLQNCQQCHEAGKQVSPANCLNCHKLLGRRISDNKGLHGLNGYSDCAACHVEHLGRDSELIIWLDGQQHFDHALTGYLLEGKHAGLDCRKCHNTQHIRQDQLPAGQYKDLARTFLGLDRSCLGCHRDEHRGQLGDKCSGCHDYNGFKPAALFSHQNTRFPLAGKHEQVLCDKCHPAQVDDKFADDIDFLKFSGLTYESCLSCHQDKHQGKFGGNCQECHNTSGWRVINQAAFDHSRTNFPLEGKHISLQCEKCHSPGKPMAGLKHEKCIDCHGDYHQGQFAKRESAGDCAECHNVYGFMPALFTIEMHQQTEFRLDGSHLAIPCIACHKSAMVSDTTETIQFKFETSRCRNCHNDPHAGETDKYVQSNGCEYCHNVASWRSVTFDHSQTKFSLEGKHQTLECRKCHQPVKQDISEHSIRFNDLASFCESCHADIHQGQFAVLNPGEKDEKKVTSCGECHSPQNWFPDRFDHDRAAFKLQGAHKKIECTACHKKIMKNDREFTWFKPMETSCASCHGAKYTNEDLGDS